MRKRRYTTAAKPRVKKGRNTLTQRQWKKREAGFDELIEYKVAIPMRLYCFMGGILKHIHRHVEKVKMANEYENYSLDKLH